MKLKFPRMLPDTGSLRVAPPSAPAFCRTPNVLDVEPAASCYIYFYIYTYICVASTLRIGSVSSSDFAEISPETCIACGRHMLCSLRSLPRLFVKRLSFDLKYVH